MYLLTFIINVLEIILTLTFDEEVNHKEMRFMFIRIFLKRLMLQPTFKKEKGTS